MLELGTQLVNILQKHIAFIKMFIKPSTKTTRFSNTTVTDIKSLSKTN